MELDGYSEAGWIFLLGIIAMAVGVAAWWISLVVLDVWGRQATWKRHGLASHPRDNVRRA